MATSAPARRTMRRFPPRSKPTATELSKGLAAGAAGGLLGSWAMIRFAELWSNLAGRNRTLLGTQEESDAASNVVDIVTRRVLHVKLKTRQKQRVATGFHYVFGTLLGAAYGALAEIEPGVTAGAGAPFGAVEWLLGNKLSAPRLGFMRPRSRYSKQERVQTFAAHVAFGLTAELVRRSMRGEI